MRTSLQLCCLGLGLMVVLLGQGMAAPSALSPDPAPIDCVWSRWSEWTACNPCGKSPTRRRSRGIEVFGQFGGRACKESIGEEEACTTEAVCPDPTQAPCSDTQFQCPSGLCIRNSLRCNLDSDCENFEDEEDCEETRSPCGSLNLDNNEQSRTAGYGVNILGSDPRMNAFNNDYFNGRCDKIRNPYSLAYERRPWNVAVLHYETLVEETVSKEIYEDSHTLTKELLNERSFKIGAGINVKYNPTEISQSAAAPAPAEGGAGGAAGGSKLGVSGGVGADIEYEKSTMIKHLTEYTTIKNKSFMRVTGKVQLSTYRLRSLNLQVDREFVEHARLYLPLEYEKGLYFGFIEDWGTHYTKNGKTGGEYDLIYVLNKDTITDKESTETKLKTCLRGGIKANVAVGGAELDGSVRPDDCTTVNPKPSGDKGGTALVEKVLMSVRGGGAVAAAAMKAQLNKEGVLNAEIFQQWASSIALVPALLDSDPEPIYSLIPLDMENANTKISNLKRGIEDYVAEYNVCKCKPCKNGATVALIDGQCMCLCPPLFEGKACQNRKTDKSAKAVIIDATSEVVAQEGNWACWVNWTGCSGGQRSRTRTCNTEGLTGASCRGETSSTDHC